MNVTPPKILDDPSVWTAASFGAARSWVRSLDEAAQDELES